MARKVPARSDRAIDESLEMETYIASFTSSSNRVFHVVLVSAVASVLAFSSYWNSRDSSWMVSRYQLARAVAREQLYDPEKQAALLARCHGTEGEERDKCERLEQALQWYKSTGYDLDTFQVGFQEIEGATVSSLQVVSVPFLGIVFDINDLGTFSSIGLALIAVILAYSMARYQENLFLCLWKIRRLAESEGRFDDGQSRSNFLYHALAMAQVFSRPPTLARWGRHYWGILGPAVLFTVPVIVQGLIFLNDLETEHYGALINPSRTTATLRLEACFGTILIIATSLSLSFLLASCRRWRDTFFELNPSYRTAERPKWRHWIWPPRGSRYRFAEGEATLHLIDLTSCTAWPIKENTIDLSAPVTRGQSEATAHMESGSAIEPSMFDRHRHSDGSYYQVRREDDVVLLEKRHHLRPGLGTPLPRSVIVSEAPLTALYLEETRLMRVENGGPEAEVVYEFRCDRQLPSMRGLVDICWNEQQAVFIADAYKRRIACLLYSDGRIEQEKHLNCNDGWRPMALAFRDSRLYIAETNGSTRSERGRRKNLRIRVIDPSTATPATIEAS